MSRRSGKKNGSPMIEDKAKEARHLYLAIDEAGTHVGAKRFRCCGPLCQRLLELLAQGCLTEQYILVAVSSSAADRILIFLEQN